MTAPGGQAQVFTPRYFKIEPARIGLLRFLLEGYDGLMSMRTVERRLALVEVTYAPTQAADAEALLQALGDELGLLEQPSPELTQAD